MKTCPNGHTVPDNAMFCTLCGARMVTTPPPSGQSAQSEYVHSDQFQSNTPPPHQQYQQPPYQQPPYQQGYQQPPYGAPFGGPPLTGFRGEIRSPGTVILLTIVTCGIYGLIWLYSISKEINAVLGREATTSSYTFIGILCFIFTYILWSQVDNALVEIDQKRGIHASNKFLTWVLLSVFLGIGVFMMQYDVQTRLNALYEGRY